VGNTTVSGDNVTVGTGGDIGGDNVTGHANQTWTQQPNSTVAGNTSTNITAPNLNIAGNTGMAGVGNTTVSGDNVTVGTGGDIGGDNVTGHANQTWAQQPNSTVAGKTSTNITAPNLNIAGNTGMAGGGNTTVSGDNVTVGAGGDIGGDNVTGHANQTWTQQPNSTVAGNTSTNITAPNLNIAGNTGMAGVGNTTVSGDNVTVGTGGDIGGDNVTGHANQTWTQQPNSTVAGKTSTNITAPNLNIAGNTGMAGVGNTTVSGDNVTVGTGGDIGGDNVTGHANQTWTQQPNSTVHANTSLNLTAPNLNLSGNMATGPNGTIDISGNNVGIHAPADISGGGQVTVTGNQSVTSDPGSTLDGHPLIIHSPSTTLNGRVIGLPGNGSSNSNASTSTSTSASNSGEDSWVTPAAAFGGVGLVALAEYLMSSDAPDLCQGTMMVDGAPPASAASQYTFRATPDKGEQSVILRGESEYGNSFGQPMKLADSANGVMRYRYSDDTGSRTAELTLNSQTHAVFYTEESRVTDATGQHLIYQMHSHGWCSKPGDRSTAGESSGLTSN
ncbi:hypothetical protein DPV79_36140, partial [Burkholderia reimsis]